MAKETTVTLIERIPRTSTIESFRFTSEENIDFLPGQFLKLCFDRNNPHNQELNKYLSFSSSPTKKYIEVTKRLSGSTFSQKLKSLQIKDEITISAPMGNIVFKPEYKKIGFLIGGIGITPVISIMEYIQDTHLDTDVLLIYSNRTEEEIAFRNILDNWRSQHKHFRIIYTLTDCTPQDPICRGGRIDKDLVLAQEDDYADRIIYLVGPPAMVTAMQNLCNEIGCIPDRVKIENFTGY